MNFPQIHLYVGTRQLHSGELSRPIELGREYDVDAGRVYSLQPVNDTYRMAIAGKNEFAEMSRRLLLVTPLGDRRIRVENLSKTNHIVVPAQEAIWPGEKRELDVPTVLSVFDRRVEIARAKQYDTILLSMNDPMRPPGSQRDTFPSDISSNFPLAKKLSAEERDQLAHWLGAVTRVLQSAISSPDFYERAAKEMVDLIGLDTGRILEINSEGAWSVIESYDRDAGQGLSSEWVPVNDLLQQVLTDKRTCWTSPSDNEPDLAGATERRAAIVAPLLSPTGEVIGALYGDRQRRESNSKELIGTLEAMLVETLARGVAAGRARVDQERVAAEVQIRFEQFFTPELSRQLAANPDLLTRRDTEISVLFCDIRQFSTVSEACGAELTMEWLSEVMGEMADCAAVYDGALIDYIGDELMLMWGAPGSQPDHATRACQAALKMARQNAKLDAKWRKRLGHATQLGFGINTGSARVGNVGFERKFRYAPFGNTVNLASRVQGATKYLGASVVVTEATFKQLRSRPISRRLCSVRVVNIEQPVVLYELRPEDSLEDKQLCEQYEEALALYEQEKLPQAIHILSQIMRTQPDDGPTLLLLSRAVESMMHGETPFAPVFELPGK
ncbi:MAG: adenylate/guanylate cyclase domain-containing protein [Pirellulales bacterium]